MFCGVPSREMIMEGDNKDRTAREKLFWWCSMQPPGAEMFVHSDSLQHCSLSLSAAAKTR